jgi:hypothetical protein
MAVYLNPKGRTNQQDVERIFSKEPIVLTQIAAKRLNAYSKTYQGYRWERTFFILSVAATLALLSKEFYDLNLVEWEFNQGFPGYFELERMTFWERVKYLRAGDLSPAIKDYLSQRQQFLLKEGLPRVAKIFGIVFLGGLIHVLLARDILFVTKNRAKGKYVKAYDDVRKKYQELMQLPKKSDQEKTAPVMPSQDEMQKTIRQRLETSGFVEPELSTLVDVLFPAEK